jgi:elongation factor G
VDSIKKELRLPAAALQIPIGIEESFEGVVDIIERVAIAYGGAKGTSVSTYAVPEELVAACEDKRRELVERLSDIDGSFASLFSAGTHCILLIVL